MTWLNELNPAYAPQIPVSPPTNPPTSRPATAADVGDTALVETNFESWVKWLRPQNIFYLSPLDLDMMMTKAFPAAYVAAFPSTASAGDKARWAVSVFGESGQGNAELGPVCLTLADEEIHKYKTLFKSSSKPGSHLLAFGKLTLDQLKSGCPEPLRALVERANELIASGKGAA